MLICQVQGVPRVPELPDQFYIPAFTVPGSDNLLQNLPVLDQLFYTSTSVYLECYNTVALKEMIATGAGGSARHLQYCVILVVPL